MNSNLYEYEFKNNPQPSNLSTLHGCKFKINLKKPLNYYLFQKFLILPHFASQNNKLATYFFDSINHDFLAMVISSNKSNREKFSPLVTKWQQQKAIKG